jgi:hypothetical protein
MSFSQRVILPGAGAYSAQPSPLMRFYRNRAGCRCIVNAELAKGAPAVLPAGRWIIARTEIEKSKENFLGH